MKDKDKTKAQLLEELEVLREGLPELERVDAARREAEKALRESEERYGTLVRTSADAVTVSDLDWRITDVSDRTLELHGCEKADELIGRSAFELIAPEDRAKAKKDLRKTLKKGSVQNVEYILLRRDETRFIGELNASLMRDAEGKPKAFVATIRDITDRNRTEKELRTSEGKYRDLVQSANSIILRYDTQGRVTFMNEFGKRFFDYREDEIVGHNILGKIVPKTDASGRDLAAMIKDLLRHPEQYVNNENENMRRNGERVWVAWTNKAVLGDDRRLVEILTIGNDITHRKQAEEALRESEEKLRLISEQSILAFGIIQDGRIKYANQAVADLVEYSIDEMLNWDTNEFARVIHPDDVSFVMEQAERKQRGDKDVVAGYSFRIVTRSGKTRWVDQYSKTIVYDGKPADLIAALDVTQRRQAEQRLRESEERLRAQYQGIPIPTYTWQKTGDDFVLVDYNNAAEALTRGGVARFLGKKASEMYQESRPDIWEDLWRCFNEKSVIKSVMPYRFELTGEEKQLATSYGFVPPDLVLVHTEDITEREHLEAQLRWSQKMETVGRLAGGVAHDFNNLLTTITGYAELAMMGFHPSDHVHNDLREILKASERAAKLTQQFLAFSRRQRIEPKVVNLNGIVLDSEKMLSRIIGEDIEVTTAFTEDLVPVMVDPGQIEQVIVNLCVNARDAMPDGGKLTIETANVTLDEAYARRRLTVTPGDYVMLAVSDTGIGMTKEVKQHLFEPFFTTKELGKGTGLGLATCYGIVKQSGGNIWVYSEKGQGTTFKIYLPRVDRKAETLPRRDEVGYLPGGTETVLLVEDEPSVRDIAARILREQGYRVLEAATGEEAVRFAKEKGDEQIRLLVTDLVMPEMGGRELADRLMAVYSDIKVLFFSGYTDEAVVRHGMLDTGAAFLQKPFSPAALTRKVRELLDR
jgi:PAS domain S-box-containing protein